MEEVDLIELRDSIQCSARGKHQNQCWRLLRRASEPCVTAAVLDAERLRVALCELHVLSGTRSSRDLPLSTDVQNASLLGIFWSTALAQFVAALTSGHLIAENEPVGLVPEGLLAVEASPSQDVVVLVSTRGELLLMDAELNVIERGTLSEPLSPGLSWPTAEDSHIIRVAWRSDGNLFAVSYPGQDQRVHVDIFRSPSLRREATAHTEPLVAKPTDAQRTPPALDLVLCWQQRPGGMLTVATRDGDVVFFERNGLRHTRMDMHRKLTSKRRIWGLSWNANDLLLAIGYTNLATDAPDSCSRKRIDLYSFRNYHWYLKYRLELGSSDFADNDHVWMAFDFTDPLLLYVYSGTWASPRERMLRLYRLQWTISLNAERDDTLAVIDGHRVLLTPLRRCVLPPPLYAFDACIPANEADDTIQYVLWEKDSLFAISSLGRWYWLRRDGALVAVQAPIPAVADAAAKQVPARDELVWNPELGMFMIHPIRSISLAGGRLLYRRRSRLLQWQPSNESSTEPARTISTDCLSVAVVSSENLIFWTTPSGSLRYHELGIELDAAAERRYRTESERVVDRGAILVAALGDALRLVIEAPRGNLETITPKICVERKIRRVLRSALDANQKPDMIALLQLARKHCIEPRFVVEAYGPKRLANDTDWFLQQILNAWSEAHVAEILTQLIVSLNEKEDVYRHLVAGFVAQMHAVDPERFFQAILTAYITQRPQADIDAALKLVSKRFSAESLRYISTIARKPIQELYRAALGIYDLDLAAKIAVAGRMDRALHEPFLESLRQVTPEALRRYEIDMFLTRPRAALGHLLEARKVLGPQVDEKICRLVEQFDLHHEAYIEVEKIEHESLTQGLWHELALRWATRLESKGAHLQAAHLYAMHGALEQAAEAYLAGGQAPLAIAAYLQKDHLIGNEHDFVSFLRRLVETLCNQCQWEVAAQILAGSPLAQPEEALQLLLDAHRFQAALRLLTTQGRGDWLRERLRPAVISAAEERTTEIRTSAAKYHERAVRLQLVREHRQQLQLRSTGDFKNPNVVTGADTDSEVDAIASEIASMSTFTFGTHSARSKSSSSSSNSSNIHSGMAASERSAAGKATAKTRKKTKRKIKPGDPHEELFLVEYLRRLEPTPALRETVQEIAECLLICGEYRLVTALQRAVKELDETIANWKRTLGVVSERPLSPSTPNGISTY